MEDLLQKIPEETLKNIYSTMLRIRMFEEKIVELYPEQEMRCPVHLCIGQEAVPAGVCANLHAMDYVFSNHRGHGHCIAKGSGFKPLMAELYGKSTGCSGGKGGSMHLIDTENGVMGTSAIVGGGIPMGVGAALASSMRGEERVTVIFFGDGAYDEGVFHESFNFASLKKLPVVFVCENNFYATNSPQSARQPVCRISESARAFNAPGVCVDGNDAAAVYRASREAVERARKGGGPTLIEAATYRWKGHVGPEEDFEKGFRDREELIHWKGRCPINAFAERLAASDIISRRDMEGLARGIEKELDEAVAYAKKSPYPAEHDLLSDVYADNG
ncbi:MAG: thiamine pyrophosphate-dependent dehydrogenase E1 component subunit alpha [Deltaproteobacteria bacterium]|nr:thiamine pyrophosphate-dependent dehydrogenase E1 component subunit alpha [Deltaproteobacteria bacterium]MBI5902146.1 thiamine pyrophosphate-dependent dehydrogenase E1 component subunit alpha [Deltaproteobacteria bacterium]